MELSYFKELWLKIIACICCTKQNEIPQENSSPENNQETTAEQEEQKYSNNQKPHENSRTKMFNGALSNPAQGQLFQGIEKSNHLIIKDAIQHGANVNTSINGLDPLQYAIRNGKDYIIEFLIQEGAEVQTHHIESAENYSMIFATNLTESDMYFPGAKNTTPILHEEIRKYSFIANILKQEMARQQRKKASEQKASADTAYANAIPNNPSAKNTDQNNQKPPTPLSERPRVVTFVEDESSPSAKASAAKDK